MYKEEEPAYQIDKEAERREILKRYRNMLNAWKPEKEVVDKRLIRKAFNLAVNAHKDMRRKSGEPYIYHPLEVAQICVGEIGLGQTSIICALLHDVVEDTDYTLEDIRGLFGDKVAQIIDGLTKISGIVFDTSSRSIQAENFRKILLTLAEDVRVILIKMADRLHNMRTLDAMKHEKQLKIASETLYIYAPLAHRLGLYAIKSEFEDLALKYTEPVVYNSIFQKLQETEIGRQNLITQFVFPIKKALREHGLDYEIEARTKSVYSIWKKMRSKEIPFEEVFDIFAIRIIVETPYDSEKSDCWRVYSLVTDFYKPKQNRLRDWISTPKANGYESLHTTVMSETGRWVEVQIRSRRMNEIAERGYAAHWKYKGLSSEESGLDKWLNRVKDLLKSSENNALLFLDEFKMNLFADEIFVFTPKGDLRTLPINSTALDFAYSIHSEVGNQCIGAKVNHRLVPISHVLLSGDQVEIITSRKQIPKEEWLDIVQTARAKSRIKEGLREEKRKFFDQGKQDLKALFQELGLELNKNTLQKLQQHFDVPSQIDLYYKVANGIIGYAEVKECCAKNPKGGWLQSIRRTFSKKGEAQSSISEQIEQKVEKNPESLLLGEEISNIRYHISRCCNAIPGDDVIGIMQDDGIIYIHRINCPEAISLMSKYGNRIVKAKWRNKESVGFLTGIKLRGTDRKGIALHVSKIITEKHNINIRSFQLASHDGYVEGEIMLYVHDVRNLNTVMENLKKIKGLRQVYRIDRADDQE